LLDEDFIDKLLGAQRGNLLIERDEVAFFNPGLGQQVDPLFGSGDQLRFRSGTQECRRVI